MRRLKMIHPVIQAPLAGGGDTPELVAAVGEAGGLGFIGGVYLTPQQVLEASRAVRARTARPFGISLFAPQPLSDAPQDPRPALECVAPFYAELKLPPPQAPALAADPFGGQLAAALERAKVSGWRGVSRPPSSSHGSPGRPKQPFAGWRCRIEACRRGVPLRAAA
jgi:nitronate monooxygenase